MHTHTHTDTYIHNIQRM